MSFVDIVTRRSSLLAAAALLLGAGPVESQSLLAGRGLGLVVDPIDARSHGLGGVSLGLIGSHLTWNNPAEAVGLPAPGLKVAYQFDQFDARYDGREVEGSTARFPLILGAFPIGDRWAVTAGIGGFLDQNSAIQRADTVLVGTDTLAVLDRFTSEGGPVRIRLGAAYRVVDGLAVGLGLDVYAGGVQRSAGRRFPDEIAPGCCTTTWTYGGTGVLAGAAWSPSEAVRVSASASLGGTLEASTDDPNSSGQEFDLPATLNAGASARVAPQWLVAVSGEWAGWSGVDEPLSAVGGARDSWSVHGGTEYDGLVIADRPIPLRLGGHYAALPFRFGRPSDPTEWPDERAVTGGLGAVLAGGAARFDVGLVRGWRGGEAAGLDESFWRTTLSVSVFGR